MWTHEVAEPEREGMREREEREAPDDLPPAARGAQHQADHEQDVIEPVRDDVLEAEHDEAPGQSRRVNGVWFFRRTRRLSRELLGPAGSPPRRFGGRLERKGR